MPDPEELVTDETRVEEEREASAKPEPGPMPTPEEEQAAKLNVPASDKVKDAYKEQMERSVKVKGEGQIP
jgi:hypothetical protein